MAAGKRVRLNMKGPWAKQGWARETIRELERHKAAFGLAAPMIPLVVPGGVIPRRLDEPVGGTDPA